MDDQPTVRTYGQAGVEIFADPTALAARAARDLATVVCGAIAARGQASIILATGSSQLGFMAALCRRRDVEWGRVIVLHMDEYLGMPERHPASFRRYMREKLIDVVHPLAFHGIAGDAPDSHAEVRRYTDLLRRYPADACVMGIGENGHLAFNDPPADFHTGDLVHIVRLDKACRRQQLGEGWFATLGDVPAQALSLTVPALLSARRLLVVVPEQRKARPVRAALEGPVTPGCPASILQRQAHATVYLDRESSSLLGPPRQGGEAASRI